MSYFENVYLARLNKNGTTRQERILATKAQQFEESFLDQSIYKVEFSVGYTPYLGVLQPVKENEKEIIYHLLIPIEYTIETGEVLEINEKKWIVTFFDPSPDKGYNKYKVYLLDRVLTWWDEDKEEHTAPIHLCGGLEKSITDSFRNSSAAPSFREATNLMHVLMQYDETIKQDTYVKIDQSERKFIVSGFDNETVPNVSYVTLDITMTRDEDAIIALPTSYWRE